MKSLSPGILFRNLLLIITAVASSYSVNSQTALNWVRTWDATAPEIDGNQLMTRPLKDIKVTTQYSDGLGRPIQTVVKQGSMQTGSQATDLVSPIVFDAFGREPNKYLPYASATATDGLFKLNSLTEQNSFYTALYGSQGETFFYGKTEFESSPFARPEKNMAPGNSWTGTNRGVQIKQWANTSIDDVRIWVVNETPGQPFGTYNVTGIYGAGLLYKSITIDEHGKQVIEFTDKEGKVILKKVQLTAADDEGNGKNNDGWLCTYYVYDNTGNLRCVIQPEGVKALPFSGWQLTTTLLNEQCFRYDYDQRNRMIRKKVPGAGSVEMVYDAKERLVMTQDANLAISGKWLITKYDNFNRPFETGLWDQGNNGDYHRSLANNSNEYPVITGTYEVLTNTYFDNYSWGIPPPLSSSFSNDFNTYMQNPSNISWPYPQSLIASQQVKGLATGTRVKVLGTSNFLYTVSFYDDKGRVIQVQSTNLTGGIDVISTQYTWAGQPLVMVQKQQVLGSNAQTTVLITQVSYDDFGRVVKTEKRQSHTQINGNIMSSYKVISENEYDKLGQLKKKKLGTDPSNPTTALETLNYEYNIRGWMLGMNRDYARDAVNSNYFGFDLGYDKQNNNLIGGQSYTAAQYNGNIAGMVWKSKGDGEKRKYDFSYDAANRLLKADFGQYNGGYFNQTAGLNYGVQMGNGASPDLAYDANGNIKSMTQFGWKVGAGPGYAVDILSYHYYDGSNRLKNVIDANNDPQTRLGDFRTSTLHPEQNKSSNTIDYTYDANGNLKKDLNKDIGTSAVEGISYNHLNLPQDITVRTNGGAVKGTITYTYDAAGNKLKKTTIENNVSVPFNGSNYTTSITTTTSYLGGAVYESKNYSNGALNSLNYPDKLQFIGHEEGRMRPVTTGFQYDYMLKDHLGNVRMLLTEEQKQDKYPVASMETAKIAIEDDYYTINPGYIVDGITVNGLPTYTNDNGIGNNPSDPAFEQSNSQKLYQLNSNTNKTGLGITLKVVAGDRIDIFGKSYYFQNNSGGAPANSAVPVLELLNGFIGSPGGTVNTSVHTGVTGSQLNGMSGTTGGISSLLSQQTAESGGNPYRPKAYINYIFFDEQFKTIGGQYGFSAVNSSAGLKDHHSELQNLTAQKSGYVYIYVSNESPVNVFFDNLQVVHTRSPILEETHYYPFGLVMAGISVKSFNYGGAVIMMKYNSIEHTTDLDINMYDALYRGLDPQLGRWLEIDPRPAFWESGYNSMSNNPVLNIDPLGDTIINGQKYEPRVPEAATYLENVTVKSIKKSIPPPLVLSQVKCHLSYQDVYNSYQDWWYNATKNLDKASGQVMPPRPSFLDFFFGQREMIDPDYSIDDVDNIYKLGGITYTKTGTLNINSNGYIVGPNVTSNLQTGTAPSVGMWGFPVLSIKQRANLLSNQLGKNSITIKTVNGHIRYDLKGLPHGPIPTPHSMRYTKHVGPNGLINFSHPKLPSYLTQQDLRIIRNYLKSLN